MDFAPTLADTVHGDHVVFAVLALLSLAAAALAPALRPHRERVSETYDLPFALEEAA